MACTNWEPDLTQNIFPGQELICQFFLEGKAPVCLLTHGLCDTHGRQPKPEEWPCPGCDTLFPVAPRVCRFCGWPGNEED